VLEKIGGHKNLILPAVTTKARLSNSHQDINMEWKKVIYIEAQKGE